MESIRHIFIPQVIPIPGGEEQHQTAPIWEVIQLIHQLEYSTEPTLHRDNQHLIWAIMEIFPSNTLRKGAL